MGLFGKKAKNIVLQWSPESDLSRKNAMPSFKPMKQMRCGGVSLLICSLDGTADGKFAVQCNVSNYEEKSVALNRGGFGLICGDAQYECAKLTIRRGKVDFLRDDTLVQSEIGFRDAVVSQFENADFTAYFDVCTPHDSFAVVVEAKRIFAANILFMFPYEKGELPALGLNVFDKEQQRTEPLDPEIVCNGCPNGTDAEIWGFNEKAVSWLKANVKGGNWIMLGKCLQVPSARIPQIVAKASEVGLRIKTNNI